MAMVLSRPSMTSSLIPAVSRTRNKANCNKFEFSTPDEQPSLPIISFSDASFGYPGEPTLFKNLNFGIDLDSRQLNIDSPVKES
ncbi:ABC transporter F family member 3-like [Dioscorea cayenensis subsp. rotundata]|uniref:ABC transporter F family member 3-like n=1 Tax=Dioscorea cayennensis subsp. rotundata TaxID=55577 RepID=A0AB40C6B5_DIOCR|nr:ABC transporter F family member 3-like [Dioscorea cayenensis subsp. rotundata]